MEMYRLNLGHSRFKAVPVEGGQYSKQSVEGDLSDLQMALKEAHVSDLEAEQMWSAHREQREKLAAYIDGASHYSWMHPADDPGPGPPKFPSIALAAGLPAEFADYLAGMIAWHNPELNDKAAARKIWEQLLERPAAQRKFKSTWAAYMLAKSWEDADPDKATAYYQKVRDLAAGGFRDSIGLAAASLGREARVCLHQKQFERAIDLYLQQLGTGDPSATNSLRFAAAAAIHTDPDTLKALAKNPLTQRVITAFIAAQGSGVFDSRSDNDIRADAPEPCRAWLAAVEAAGVKDVDSAEKLALSAYQRNEMAMAQRWIKRAPNGLVAQWLQAKLFLRAGKLREAATLLAHIAPAFPVEPRGTNDLVPSTLKDTLFTDIDDDLPGNLTAARQVLGELGALRLSRREFVQSLDALLNAGFWMDAAYVAERVLSLEELQHYVDSNWPPVSQSQEAEDKAQFGNDPVSPARLRQQVRYLLARRLMRASRGYEAKAYYPAEWLPACDRLLTALDSAWNEALPQNERARSLFETALIVRTNGMEIMGTEVGPDWHFYDGQFEGRLTAPWRRTNDCARTLVASEEELQRAAMHNADPEERFHYRLQAASLAWEAAKLMPDNSDETARVLCQAGKWVTSPQTADIFYKALVRRNRKTALGAEADAIRWFPPLDANGNMIVRGKLDLTTQKMVRKLKVAASEDPDQPPSLEDIPESADPAQPTETGQDPAELGYRYMVVAGDTFKGIARRFTGAGVPVTPAEIQSANNLSSFNLTVGQALFIPIRPAQ